uniref:ORF1 n=1 Tax=Carrot torradovirus 1 TaxID=1425364 RepID=A0A6M6A8T7_9SECO|nr:ORF1 [Carrot torradovirus 1]
MSFVRGLDISEEEAEFQRTIASSSFLCVVSSELLTVPAKTVLDFRRVESGVQYSVLRVEWRHKFPQPFGFHILPSGSWNVSGVRFGGSLVRRACRLQTVEKVLESNKGKLSGSAYKEKVASLEEQIATLHLELEKAQASASKAKAKLKALREVISSAKEQAEVLTQGVDIPTAKEDIPSTSQNNGSNDSLFKSWADSGNAD